MSPSEASQYPSGKIEKVKKNKDKELKRMSGYLKDVQNMVASFEKTCSDIGEIDQFIDLCKSNGPFEKVNIHALLLWVEFVEVQDKPIARVKMAPLSAAQDDFGELVAALRKLPMPTLGKLTFNVTIWNTTEETFALELGKV